MKSKTKQSIRNAAIQSLQLFPGERTRGGRSDVRKGNTMSRCDSELGRVGQV